MAYVPDRMRTLAGEWHGGQASPLYALASACHIGDPDDLAAEIATTYRQTLAARDVDPESRAALADLEELAAWVESLCECDESEALPCEHHCETIAAGAGSAAYSGDEVTVNALEAVAELYPDAIGAEDLETLAEARAGLAAAAIEGSSWLEDIDLADAVRDIADRGLSLPDGVMLTFDDGWQLFRVTGGPLA